MPCFISKIGTRRNYNARKYRLVCCIGLIRNNLSDFLSASNYENVLLIDSMPIEVCRYSRAKGCRILKDNEHQAPTFGFCASQQKKYFGYKLHCVCTAE